MNSLIEDHSLDAHTQVFDIMNRSVWLKEHPSILQFSITKALTPGFHSKPKLHLNYQRILERRSALNYPLPQLGPAAFCPCPDILRN